jgi:hypothetical protein
VLRLTSAGKNARDFSLTPAKGSKMRVVFVGAALLFFTSGAIAAPLRARNATSVRVAVDGRRERAFGVRGAAHGWRLELLGARAAVAEIHDVTPGAQPGKWLVPLDDDAVVFDDARFVAGHAYRVELRRGVESVGSALVYLYPPRAQKSARVQFDDSEAASSDGDDEIAITPKPSL